MLERESHPGERVAENSSVENEMIAELETQTVA